MSHYQGIRIDFKDSGNPLPDTVQLTIVKTIRYTTGVKEFADLIKATVPVSNRTYDPSTKVWTLTTESFIVLNKIMDTLHITYRRVLSLDKDKFGQPATPKIDPNNFFYNTTPVATAQTRESVAAQLASILGCDLSSLQVLDVQSLKKLYRKKALELHPDRNNGDGSKMSELNSLWSVYNAGV